jgi:branched-chain amino acid transport system substrate-binding protein
MVLKRATLGLLVGGAALMLVAAASARPTAHTATAARTCGTATIGMLAPITGPAASIGGDQLHWAEFYVQQWNKGKHAIKLKLVQGDTQLDPAKASTVAQSFASNTSMVGVIGPAGSDEVIATAPILKRAGFAFISGSATRVSLTDGKLKGFFYRVVPNDGVQGPSDVGFMMSKLGVKKGTTVMVVDDQEAYSTGLADIVQKGLKAKGVKVNRESISQKATDFSALVAKVDSGTKVVFTPFQLASQAQLIAQQLQAQGKSAIVFGSDGTFDSSKFNAPGNYISFFAPDVTTIKADAALVKAFHKAHPGATSPFGAPNYVAAQAFATAANAVCLKGKSVTRASVRAQLAKTKLKNTILGGNLAFTKKGDVAGAKFHIFKIMKGGKYVTVA